MNIKVTLRKAFAGVALAAAMGGSFSAGYVTGSSEPGENVVATQPATIAKPPVQVVETTKVATNAPTKKTADAVKPAILTADEADLLYAQPRPLFPLKTAAADGENYSALGAAMNRTKPPILTADEADALYAQPRIQIQWGR